MNVMFIGENNSNDPLNHEKRWENYLSYDMVPILKVSYLIVKKRFFWIRAEKNCPVAMHLQILAQSHF